MPLLQLSSLSTEYVRVPVSAFEDGVEVNPSPLAVEMAFPAYGVEPAGGDWVTAEWEPGAACGGWFARCLVGPAGAVTLANGSYDVWVRVTDSPETPVRKAGPIRIT